MASNSSRSLRGPSPGEMTPLLRSQEPKEVDDAAGPPPRLAEEKDREGNGVIPWLLLCGFFVSLTFAITQVPILFAFRVMTCTAFYEQHTPDPRIVDICNKREIEAGAARAFALLAASTTIFGLVNLLVVGWTIKRQGVKLALVVQVFFSALRLAIQNVGITVGSSTGILIVQASQIITIFGGPNGYVLCLNSFIADVASNEGRTGALGRLQGSMYIGTATGFLIGGLVGDAFGIAAPFRMTLILFLLCCAYIAVALPKTSPPPPKEKPDTQSVGIKQFLGPLHVFAPQKWTLPSGRTTTQFGALLLGIGVFLGILATGYIAVLLQMYATAEFDFGTKANGWLIFIYSALRGAFLTFAFPRIVAVGRKWMTARERAAAAGEARPLIEAGAPSPQESEVLDVQESDAQPANPPREDEQETFAFDLLYARFSLLLDGILTALAVFVSKGWQMYVVALILPFAAGTGASSKGSMLQMLPASERVDALSGITLVENMARLSTSAVFGLTFAALEEVGEAKLVFVCNAAVALLGFVVLLFSHFPPTGSRRVAH